MRVYSSPVSLHVFHIASTCDKHGREQSKPAVERLACVFSLLTDIPYLGGEKATLSAVKS